MSRKITNQCRSTLDISDTHREETHFSSNRITFSLWTINPVQQPDLYRKTKNNKLPSSGVVLTFKSQLRMSVKNMASENSVWWFTVTCFVPDSEWDSSSGSRGWGGQSVPSSVYTVGKKGWNSLSLQTGVLSLCVSFPVWSHIETEWRDTPQEQSYSHFITRQLKTNLYEQL